MRTLLESLIFAKLLSSLCSFFSLPPAPNPSQGFSLYLYFSFSLTSQISIFFLAFSYISTAFDCWSPPDWGGHTFFLSYPYRSHPVLQINCYVDHHKYHLSIDDIHFLSLTLTSLNSKCFNPLLSWLRIIRHSNLKFPRQNS